MIFDITQHLADGSLDTVRYKPRNKAICRGALRYRGEEIASIKTLAVYFTQYSPEGTIVVGHFDLEWFRIDVELPFLADDLSVYAEYGEGKPPELINGWVFPAIAIIKDGIPMAIGSLRDLMATENTFLCKDIKVIDYTEEQEREEQLVKETFSDQLSSVS